MSSEEFTDDRMNCVRPEGQTLIHPVVQGHYTRYSIIKDQPKQTPFPRLPSSNARIKPTAEVSDCQQPL